MPKLTPIQDQYDSKVAAIHRLRVNLKSLAAEARIIRHETRRAGPAYRDELALHRRGRLREEARYTHLALAFLRGRAYRQVEKEGSKEVSAARLIKKLGLTGPEIVTTIPIEKWLK